LSDENPDEKDPKKVPAMYNVDESGLRKSRPQTSSN